MAAPRKGWRVSVALVASAITLAACSSSGGKQATTGNDSGGSGGQVAARPATPSP